MWMKGRKRGWRRQNKSLPRWRDRLVISLHKPSERLSAYGYCRVRKYLRMHHPT